MKNARKRSCCTDSGGVWSGSDCKASDNETDANTWQSNDYKSCIGEKAD